MRCARAITRKASISLMNVTGWACLYLPSCPAGKHIGDGAWKDRACAMLREMLLQNRNHPSIILWGVRINESVDDDEFYTRTNQIAHALDPSRATSGVRYLERAISWKMFTPTTISPTTAQTPGPSGKRM